MNQGTKQRIVGTVVLLAAALIFLPIIFDGEGSYEAELSSRIPVPPLVPVLADPIPSRPVITADVEQSAVAEEPAESVEETSPEETIAVADEVVEPESSADSGIPVEESEADFTQQVPDLAANGLPEGWSVRLGSFSDSRNADALLQRLLGAGYRAYVRMIDSSRGQLSGVYVGPWVDRSRVERYKAELQEKFQLAGLVVAYEIEQL